jgi:hypothetical protein
MVSTFRKYGGWVDSASQIQVYQMTEEQFDKEFTDEDRKQWAKQEQLLRLRLRILDKHHAKTDWVLKYKDNLAEQWQKLVEEQLDPDSKVGYYVLDGQHR